MCADKISPERLPYLFGTPGNIQAEDVLRVLATGEATRPFELRAEKTKEFLQLVLGADPGALTQKTPETPQTNPALGSIGRHQNAIRQRAQAFFDDFLGRKLDKLSEHLTNYPYILWPDGSFGRYSKEDLIELLESRAGEPAPAFPDDLRIYSPGELNNILPRTLNLILAGMEARNGALATISIDSPRFEPPRLMTALATDFDGNWKVQALPLPSLDEAWCQSTRPKPFEDEWLRIADKVLRHARLGHSSQLQALRNHLALKLFIEGQILSTDEFINISSEDPHRIDASETVFLGTKNVRPDKLKGSISVGTFKKFQAACQKLFHKPFNRLNIRVAKTEIGSFDPDELRVVGRRDWYTLYVQLHEFDGRKIGVEKWRLGAIFEEGA